MSNKKKSKFSTALICGICIGIFGYILTIVLLSFTRGNEFSLELLYNRTPLLVLGCCFVLGIILPFISKKKGPSAAKSGKTASGDEFSLSYDAHYMTDKELYDGFGLINATWDTLPKIMNTGTVIRNVNKNGKYEVTMKDEVHTLVFGTTGSGKTSAIIDPSIRILAHTGEKPSIIVSDPKGELYERHAAVLRKEGYQVVVYDLDNPFVSERWNPMENAFNLYHRAMKIGSEAKKYSNCTPEAAGKQKIDGMEYGDVWYEFEGKAIPSEEMLRKELASVKQQLINDAMFDLRGVAAAVCPIDPNTQDKTWEQGAQDYLYGIMLAMLEDSLDERLGENKLKKEQFNFYNLYKIATKRDPDPDNPFGSLRKYCGSRLKTSDVPSITSTVVNTAPNTAKSYMSVLSGKIAALMQDMGICFATSGSDIDFKKFTDKPTIFFLKIPDHKKERAPLGVVCISQLYRALVDVANKCEGLKLPRHVYFLLDEFGSSFPVIPDFATMITVARSRNIFFEIVVQSYTQLDTKYGKDTAETLKGNFNAQIYLGTDDQATKEAFSKSCGEVQLLHEEKQLSESKGKGADSSSKSTSTSVQRTTRSLITPYELGQLPFGWAIVKLFRSSPLKTEATQFHKTSVFDKTKAAAPVGLSKSLNEETVFYDIDKRNSIVYKPSPSRW